MVDWEFVKEVSFLIVVVFLIAHFGDRLKMVLDENGRLKGE